MTQKINENKEYTFKDFDASYIQELANKNSFRYSARTKSHDIESSLFNNQETSTDEIHKIDMTVDHLPCEYYTANWRPWTLPNEMNSQWLVQIFAITLPYEIESLYVESRTNFNINSVLGLPSIVFDDSENVNLEGDFNYFFNVYALKNQEISVFTVLAPNIMVRMLEKGSGYDFEFAKNKIYFYKACNENGDGVIPLRQKDYEKLLNFGIESARIMARASRPTELNQINQSKAIWQLYNAKSSKKVARIANFTLALLFIFPFIIIGMILAPSLRPLLAILIFFVLIKYEIFKLRRRRLIQRWGNDYQNLNLIKK